MKSYKQPDFQDRIASAAAARQTALEKLRTRPPVDESAAAERQAARLAKEAAQREKSRLARQAADEAKAAKRARALEEQASAAIVKPELTEAERKAARDARYLARKSRKKS